MNALSSSREPDEPVVPRARPALTVAPLELSGSLTFGDFRLAYTEFGRGDKVIVLAHGLLMTRRMHRPLARRLARDGFRVITVDLLGHGDSDRPTQSWLYSMPGYAEQVLALLDHLEIEQAVVGGTSLGANVSLEVGVIAPDRLRGLLIEMPVLDNAIFAGLLAFPPLLYAAKFAPFTVRAAAFAARLVPRGNQWIDVVTDTLRQHPQAMAAVLHGLLFGRIAPPKALRRKLHIPALILGHSRDPIHPFGDADALAADMPSAQFLHASSPVELRFRPERLTQAMIAFLSRCYAEAAPSG